MFRRSFMSAFQIRKYAKPSMDFGILSSNYPWVSSTEVYIRKFGIFAVTIYLAIAATGDFEVFYEVVAHTKPVHNQTLYEKDIPNAVRIPNQEIMENFKKLHEGNKLMKTFQVQ